MSDDKTRYWQIDAYLNGSLSESERKAFEIELASHPALQEMMEDSRLANLAFQKSKLWEMKRLTEQIDREQIKRQKTKKIAIATIGLALLAALSVYMMVTKQEKASAPCKPLLPQKPTIEQSMMAKPVPDVVPQTISQPNKRLIVTKKESVPTHQALEPNTITTAFEEKKETPVLSNVPSSSVNETVMPTKLAEIKKTENLCEKTSIEASVFAEKACLHNQNGRIHVSNFKGGSQPYQVKILDEAKQIVSALQVSAGSYSVIITDNHGCVKTIEDIVVQEMDCRKDFELNMSAGELFELEGVQKSATFLVYDNDGNKYFYKEMAKGEKIQWNGTPSQGEAKTGYFRFQVSYQDGETRMGSITVVR